MRNIIKAVHVHAIRASSSKGILAAGNLVVPCALGRTGLRVLKREGDGATPIGRWRFGRLFWRPDRRGVPQSALPSKPLRPDMGWCDAALDRNYNRPVKVPYPSSHEDMWRNDGSYDVVVTLSHNVRPRVAGHGSAVFFHLAAADLKPTAGCVAVRPRDAARLLQYLGPQTELVVQAGGARPSRDGRKSLNPREYRLRRRQ